MDTAKKGSMVTATGTNRDVGPCYKYTGQSEGIAVKQHIIQESYRGGNDPAQHLKCCKPRNRGPDNRGIVHLNAADMKPAVRKQSR